MKKKKSEVHLRLCLTAKKQQASPREEVPFTLWFKAIGHSFHSCCQRRAEVEIVILLFPIVTARHAWLVGWLLRELCPRQPKTCEKTKSAPLPPPPDEEGARKSKVELAGVVVVVVVHEIHLQSHLEEVM